MKMKTTVVNINRTSEKNRKLPVLLIAFLACCMFSGFADVPQEKNRRINKFSYINSVIRRQMNEKKLDIQSEDVCSAVAEKIPLDAFDPGADEVLKQKHLRKMRMLYPAFLMGDLPYGIAEQYS